MEEDAKKRPYHGDPTLHAIKQRDSSNYPHQYFTITIRSPPLIKTKNHTY
jgi:hypothetical protein